MRFETYHEGANGATVASLKQLVRESGRSGSWVHGPAGVGKTHLLQACCALAGQSGLTSAYLPLAASRALQRDGRPVAPYIASTADHHVSIAAATSSGASS